MIPITEQREARQLTYDLWMWLGANPTKGKQDWPRHREIEDMRAGCPLCELFINGRCTWKYCKGCPLDACGKKCFHSLKYNKPNLDPFARWDLSEDGKQRQTAAYEIALVVACWSIEGDGGI